LSSACEEARNITTRSCLPVARSVPERPLLIAISDVNTATTPAKPITITRLMPSLLGMVRKFASVIAEI
jgi:hypothetical protein